MQTYGKVLIDLSTRFQHITLGSSIYTVGH